MEQGETCLRTGHSLEVIYTIVVSLGTHAVHLGGVVHSLDMKQPLAIAKHIARSKHMPRPLSSSLTSVCWRVVNSMVRNSMVMKSVVVVCLKNNMRNKKPGHSRRGCSLDQCLRLVLEVCPCSPFANHYKSPSLLCLLVRFRKGTCV